MDSLNNRFCEVWNRNSIDPRNSNCTNIYNSISELYAQSWKAYHNIGHIQACLSYFDACKDDAILPDAIELAIWFHDCVYTVGATDNEKKSKVLFLEESENILNDNFRHRIGELIMDTCHRSSPITQDGKLLADIDLTSFGLPWEEYLADGKNVKQELDIEPSLSAGDATPPFIQNLLKRERIYYSPYYLKNYEQSAQNNLARHMQLINSK
jgi:predicted metal-dependent HD superfamily phosphohydrolase